MTRGTGLVRFLAIALVCLAAASSGGGCAYARARGRDFSQVLRLEIGPSLSFGFDTRLGGLMDLGLGGGFMWVAGLEYGEGYLGKQELIVAPGVCLRGLGPTEVWSHECPSVIPPLLAQEQYTQAKYTHLGTLRHEFDIEVAVMAVILYFRFGLSPAELGDAFAGIFGFDPAGDDGDGGGKPAPAPDVPPVYEQEKRKPPPAGPARPVGETPYQGTDYHKVPPAGTPAPAPPPPPPAPPPPRPKPAPASGSSTSTGASSGEVVEPKAPKRGE